MESEFVEALDEISVRKLGDGLPHDCRTETVAKPARLGPAENDKPTENLVESSMFCSMKCCKVHVVERISKINMDIFRDE